VVDATGELLYRVGDRPDRDEFSRVDLFNNGELYYRMKALKPRSTDYAGHPRVWDLARRNIYTLGGMHLLPDAMGLTIESTAGDHLDASGLPWVRIFGLDRPPWRDPEATSLLDIDLRSHCDFQRGLLFFPTESSRPFAADRTTYESWADSPLFVWSTSLLPGSLGPALYDFDANAGERLAASHYRLVITMPDPASWER